MAARIIAANGALEFYSPYDVGMLADFKAAIPSVDRRWDAAKRCWLVAAGQLPQLERLCDQHGLIVVKQLGALYDAPRTVQRIIEVRYIGAPKERDDGSFTAMGYVNTYTDPKGRPTGEWSIVFPQDVLRGWFEIGPVPAAAPKNALTYYAALGVKRNADAAAIKAGYRSMAKRWHPDVNRDPDATEMFKQIGLAYEVLSDADKRRRYDAGLALEASLSANQRPVPHLADSNHWRPPLRCGWLLVEGQERLGRIIVAKIHQWQPITRADGRELVTSWPMGAPSFLECWV